MAEKVISVLLAIVVVAGVTTIVVHGAGSSAVLGSFFSGFSGSLRAAQGN